MLCFFLLPFYVYGFWGLKTSRVSISNCDDQRPEFVILKSCQRMVIGVQDEQSGTFEWRGWQSNLGPRMATENTFDWLGKILRKSGNGKGFWNWKNDRRRGHGEDHWKCLSSSAVVHGNFMEIYLWRLSLTNWKFMSSIAILDGNCQGKNRMNEWMK